jgi:uncharacterized protein YecT (DUF1311 family)
MNVLALTAAIVALAAPLEPPVIHEMFTPLPCPKSPRTTVALEGCSEKAILTTDRAINKQVNLIFALLRTRSAKATFVAGEKSWQRYRRSSCIAQASFYDGGSAQPVVYGNCIAARNRTHLRDLAALKATLSQH